MKITLRRIVTGAVAGITAGSLFGIFVGNMADNGFIGAIAGTAGVVASAMIMYIWANHHYNSNEHKHAHR